MRTRPILFSAPMVLALLEGRKTQTRRVIKPRGGEEVDPEGIYDLRPGDLEVARCPYGQVGDLLWVREHWGYRGMTTCGGLSDISLYYHTDEKLHITRGVPFEKAKSMVPKQNLNLPDPYVDWDGYQKKLRNWWKRKRSIPAIYMPLWASRLTLGITDVRVERLQEISENDAVAEGCRPYFDKKETQVIGNIPMNPLVSPQESYARLWEEIKGQGSWATNPWVWVIEFTVHQKNVDDMMPVVRNDE